MNTLSRRQFICSAVAAGAAIYSAPAIPLAPAAVPGSFSKLAWAAGTPGEYDWDWFFAKTGEEAERAWLDERFGECSCESVRKETSDPDERCDRCYHDVDSIPMDIANQDKGATSADWIRSGMGTYCSRCNCEAEAGGGAQAVGDEAVCKVCMELADLDIVDPEYAAELRAEASELEDATQ